MRTTVTLDPDVAEQLNAYAHQKRISFKKAINELVRRGLEAPTSTPRRKKFKVVPQACGFRPGIDPNRLNQLVDELEVQDFIRESRDPR